MTKEEKIMNDWGDSYSKLKKNIDDNGWCNNNLIQDDEGDIIVCGEGHIFKASDTAYCLNWLERCPKCNSLVTNNSYHHLFLQIYDDKFDETFGKYRPKSLQGIETNNGWVKMLSEEDLPKEEGFYHIIDLNRVEMQLAKFDIHHNVIVDYWIKNVTHYQPIENLKPPIY